MGEKRVGESKGVGGEGRGGEEKGVEKRGRRGGRGNLMSGKDFQKKGYMVVTSEMNSHNIHSITNKYLFYFLKYN